MEITLETTLKRSNPLAMMQELLRRTAITHSETAHCEKHGEYTADVSADGRKSPCPLCQAEAKAAEQAEQAERENRRLTEKLGHCGIPKRHQGCRVNTYRAETAKQQALKTAVTEYVREMQSGGLKRNFVMLGNCGTGKTHLACAIGMEAVRQSKTVLFATASEIIRRVQAAHKSDTETEWGVMQEFEQLDLLIVDEVGVQYATESANRIITEIVNARYNAEKPTVFISNLGADEFQAVMGERAMSRMMEDGCKPFVCDWADYRKGGAA